MRIVFRRRIGLTFYFFYIACWGCGWVEARLSHRKSGVSALASILSPSVIASFPVSPDTVMRYCPEGLTFSLG